MSTLWLVIAHNVSASFRIRRRTYLRAHYTFSPVSCHCQKIIEYQLSSINDRPAFIYRGRNYLFQLNLNLTIDGMYAGNETRFINHAPDGYANAQARGAAVSFIHIQPDVPSPQCYW